MDRYFSRILVLCSLVALFAISTHVAQGGSPVVARLTQVTNDVQLVDTAAAARPASLDENVTGGIAVRTGKDSRAELTFSDDLIVRLAADTAFSFKNGVRDLNLEKGALFVEASKKAKHATVHAAEVAATISGTTAMLEYHPGACKFLVLEGTGRLYRPGHLGDSVLVSPGRMIICNPTSPLADPVDFDIGRFVRTSRFILDFPPLRSAKAMAQASEKQQREKSKKSLIDTNLVIFGGGTLVSLVDPARLNAPHVKGDMTPSPTPTPTPEGAITQ
jgi:hypothetical protein